MENSNVINKVYDLIDSIKKSEEFTLLKEMKSEINISLSDLIERFNIAKDKYTEATKYGDHHPDLEKYKKELSKLKEELFTNELVEKYKRLEKLLQEKLDTIINDVKKSMSNKFEQTKKIDI